MHEAAQSWHAISHVLRYLNHERSARDVRLHFVCCLHRADLNKFPTVNVSQYLAEAKAIDGTRWFYGYEAAFLTDLYRRHANNYDRICEELDLKMDNQHTARYVNAKLLGLRKAEVTGPGTEEREESAHASLSSKTVVPSRSLAKLPHTSDLRCKRSADSPVAVSKKRRMDMTSGPNVFSKRNSLLATIPSTTPGGGGEESNPDGEGQQTEEDSENDESGFKVRKGKERSEKNFLQRNGAHAASTRRYPRLSAGNSFQNPLPPRMQLNYSAPSAPSAYETDYRTESDDSDEDAAIEELSPPPNAKLSIEWRSSLEPPAVSNFRSSNGYKVHKRKITGPVRKQRKGVPNRRWSDEEDTALLKVYSERKTRLSWAAVAELLSEAGFSRSAKACELRIDRARDLVKQGLMTGVDLDGHLDEDLMGAERVQSGRVADGGRANASAGNAANSLDSKQGKALGKKRLRVSSAERAPFAPVVLKEPVPTRRNLRWTEAENKELLRVCKIEGPRPNWLKVSGLMERFSGVHRTPTACMLRMRSAALAQLMGVEDAKGREETSPVSAAPPADEEKRIDGEGGNVGVSSVA